MRLVVFDCDNTVWNLPYPEEDSYMKTVESILDHHFVYKEEILEDYFRYRKNPNNKFVILTNRLKSLENVIVSKLEKEKNLYFDYKLFMLDNNDRDKGIRLKGLVEELKGVKEIIFYDDKDKHLYSIYLLKSIFPEINITVVKVL